MGRAPSTPMLLAATLAFALHGTAGVVGAQPSRPWGHVSFFTTASQVKPEAGDPRSWTEVVTTATYHSADDERDGTEFAVDARIAGYTIDDREARVSIYDAWVGAKLLDGTMRVRGGQLWLNELGGLGAIGGGTVEYQHATRAGRLRVAGFGGLEPKAYSAGYVDDVTRFGGYAALDGGGARRNILGYVLVRNAGLVERSVLTMTNYVPVRRAAFLYQAAEIDLRGPAGQGTGGLTYFFMNARVTPTRRVDLQATYHRGRSLDARTITLDQLNGRPIAASSLEGLLFESAGGRVTVEVARGLRVYGGYGRDRNNRDSEPGSRVNAGAQAVSVLGSGVDLTVSAARIDRGAAGSFDSWYISAGRSVGPNVYVSGDFTSALSVLALAGSDGFVVEARPRSRRVSGTTIVNLNRSVSLLVTAEHSDDDDATENRVMMGLTYRLR